MTPLEKLRDDIKKVQEALRKQAEADLEKAKLLMETVKDAR
jgi:hypothetical protein